MRPWTEQTVGTLSDAQLIRHARQLRRAVELLRSSAPKRRRPIADLQYSLGLMEAELIRRDIDHPMLQSRQRHKPRTRRIDPPNS